MGFLVWPLLGLLSDLDRERGITEADRFKFAIFAASFRAAFWSRLRTCVLSGLLLVDILVFEEDGLGFRVFLGLSFRLSIVTLLCGLLATEVTIFFDFDTDCRLGVTVIAFFKLFTGDFDDFLGESCFGADLLRLALGAGAGWAGLVLIGDLSVTDFFGDLLT